MTAVLSLLIPRLSKTALYSLQATDALKGFTEITIQMITLSWPDEEHGKETPTTTRWTLMGTFPSVIYTLCKRWQRPGQREEQQKPFPLSLIH